MHPVAVEYPHSILSGTLTCSSHSGTALYETHVAGQEESGCVYRDMLVVSPQIVSMLYLDDNKSLNIRI